MSNITIPVYTTPEGYHRALGRDTETTVKHWNKIVSSVPIAPKVFRGVIPNKSPNIRRFYHGSFISQRQRGFCFPAGTLVLLDDGTEKSIEEIVVGDKVLTHLGRSRKVVNTFERKYSGTMVSINVKGWRYPLTMTENHPVFVVRNSESGWRTKTGYYRPGEVVKLEAKELRPKNYIIMSRGIPSEMKDIRIDVRDYVKDSITTMDGKRCKRVGGTHEINWDILVDEKFARLIGLYIAEGGYDSWGRANPSRIRVHFHREERDFLNFVEMTIGDIFGIDVKIVNPETSETRSFVECNSTLLSIFFKNFCGENIYEKFINPIFFRARPDIKRALIRGWLDGDGHIGQVGMDGMGCDKSIRVIGTTVSEELNREMFRLASSIGIKGSAIRRKPKNRANMRYDLCFYSNDAIALYPELRKQSEDAGIILDGARNHHAHELGYLCKIDKITFEDVEDIQVFNFEVEEDHSYIANGISVSNCGAFNWTATLMTRLRIPAGATPTTGDPLPLIRLSPLYVYDIGRWQHEIDGYHLRGDGLIGTEVAIATKNKGCVFLQDYDSSPYAIDTHQLGVKPDSISLNIGIGHLVKEFSVADSLDHGFELLAGGFPLVFASDIPEGMMHTDETGLFHMTGDIVGGHLYQVLDFDKSQDLIWIAQSWEYWGEKTNDPQYHLPGEYDMHGYTQLGRCSITELEPYFTKEKISSGDSEIIAVNTVAGFDPVIDYSDMI